MNSTQYSAETTDAGLLKGFVSLDFRDNLQEWHDLRENLSIHLGMLVDPLSGLPLHWDAGTGTAFTGWIGRCEWPACVA